MIRVGAWRIGLLAAGWILASARAAEPVVLQGRAMGTTWKVTLGAGSFAEGTQPLARRIDARLEELERIFSTYRADSALSRFNASPSTDWHVVPQELAVAAVAARRISELTGGAFDVTVQPLLELWGFGPGGPARRLPHADDIQRARARVGWEHLAARTEPPALRKARADLAADFSSVAKGFAVDRVSELLGSLGVRDHVVQIGGDVLARGQRVRGGGWRLGVESPLADAPGLAAMLEVADAALSTSGNYRNVIEAHGRRLGHIIDPRTGRPVEGEWAAVSVVHPSCAWSSALGTGLFVLGVDAGLALAEREGLAVAFFVRDGDAVRCRATAAFERLRR